MNQADPRILTRDQARKPCTGAIHSFLRKVDVICPDGTVGEHRIVLGLSRQSPAGVEVQFATIYRHPSGSVAMHTAGCAVTADTLENEVLPRMRDFDQAAPPQGASSMADAAKIAAHMGILAGIGCSKGSCEVCRPVREAFDKARSSTKTKPPKLVDKKARRRRK